MSLFFRIIKHMFFGLILGYILTVTSAQSTWLEMRFNTALMLPLLAGSGFILAFSKAQVSRCWVLISEVVFVLLTAFVYSFNLQAVFDMAAIFLREGFLMEDLSLTASKFILVIIFLLGNLSLIKK